MIRTIGDLKREMSSIDINKMTKAQKGSYAELNNWASGFNNDDAISPPNLKILKKRLKNLKKIIVKMNEITKSKADELFQAMEKTITYLYDRWQDEKEYEEWNDYIEHMKKLFVEMQKSTNTENAVFVKASKRPFGFTFDFEGWRFVLSTNSKAYGWKADKL